MTAPLEDSVRKIICDSYDARDTCKAIAKKYGIKYRTVVSIVALYRATTRVTALRKRAGRPRVMNEEMKKFMKGLMDNDISIWLKEIQEMILGRYGVEVSITTLQRVKRGLSVGMPDTMISMPDAAAIVEPVVTEPVVISENDRDSLEDFNTSTSDTIEAEEKLKRKALEERRKRDLRRRFFRRSAWQVRKGMRWSKA